MVTILMSAKFTKALDLLKIKVMTPSFLCMTSQIKFYQVTQIILQMQSCDQSLVTLAFL